MMPQFSNEEHPYYQSFRNKQIIIWSALFLIVIGVSVPIFYLSYQFVANKESNAGIANKPIVKQSTAKCDNCLLGETAKAAPQGKEYIIYGAFFKDEQRYKIFKTYHDYFSSGEIFSFSWQDTDTLPALAEYPNDKVAVFTGFNNGFLIDHAGKIGGIGEFVPPYYDFTISPDGKKMFYFKHLSSLGTTALALRDMEKGVDLRVWPVSSPASGYCDFSGWSDDGKIAYCLAKKGNGIELKSLNSAKYSVKTLASFNNVNDAKYYSKQSFLVAASGDSIISLDLQTGDEKTIFSLPNGHVFNVYFLPDDAKIVFTASESDNKSFGIYSVNIDGSNVKNIVSSKYNAFLISVSENYKELLYRGKNEENELEDYFIISADESESHHASLGVPSDIHDLQIVGWYE